MLKFVRIFLITISFLTGCAQTTEPISDNNDFLHASDPMPKPQGQSVSYPSTYDINTVNPITIESHVISGKGIVTGEYVIIDGLIQTEVENKINDELRNAAESMSRYRDRDQAPTYRGIDSRIPRTVRQAESIVVNAYVSYNQNRILSVVITGFVQFEQRGQSYEYSVCEGLNFDLNTGNRLSISDVLTNDADIPKLLLPLIHQQLGWTNDYESDEDYPYLPAIVAPFTEIRGSQNFYLDESGIILVFDMNTPELDTRLQPFQIPLYYSELGSYVALAHRFNEDSAIFESEITEKRFFLTEAKNEVVSTTTIQEENPIIRVSTRHEEGLSPIYIDRAAVAAQRIRPLIQDVMTKLPSIKQVSVIVMVSNVSKFTMISTWMIAQQFTDEDHAYPDSGWDSYDIEMQASAEIFEVYDENNKLLTLKDLFIAGYDYEKIVSYKLREALSMRMLDFEKFHAPLLQNLTFRLSAQTIDFFGFAWIDGNLETLGFSIPYREIRAKNLTIFD